MILHGIDVPKTFATQHIDPPSSDYGEKDRVEVVATNPPFGAWKSRHREQLPSDFRTGRPLTSLVLIMNLLKKGAGCGGPA